MVVGLSGAKSPWMSLTLDAIKNNGLSPSLLLFGGEHAREIFAIFASLRLTAEGDSYGSLIRAVLRTRCT